MRIYLGEVHADHPMNRHARQWWFEEKAKKEAQNEGD